MGMNAQDFTSLSKQLLCPPGEGVFTVNTAKEKKDGLHQLLYGNKDPKDAWQSELQKINQQEQGIALLGVCSDTGGGIQRGANWGPLYIRQALYQYLSPQSLQDVGDVRIIPHLLHDKYLNQTTIDNCRKALYKTSETTLPVSPLSMTEKWVSEFHATYPKKKILSLGGDHSVSYALALPYFLARKKAGIRAGLVHFDAHTDLLTERLGIDLCFGSWVPHVLPALNDPKDVVQIGIRSSGKDRNHWENSFGLKQYWSKEVRQSGAQSIAQDICARFKAQGIQEIYISFDIDALDSHYAGATGTPEDNGLFPDECSAILWELGKHFSVGACDLVEVAPMVGLDQINQQATLMSASSIAQVLIALMKNP
jgi:agmatinase